MSLDPQIRAVLTPIKETLIRNRWRPLQNTTTDPGADLWSPVSADRWTAQLPNLRPRFTVEEREKGFEESEVQEFCSEIVSFKTVREATLMKSHTSMAA